MTVRSILTLAVDWPGWCRSDREEKAALQALIDYGPRYAQVLQASGAQFQVPTDVADLVVVERHEGNSTTVLCAPGGLHVPDHAWEIEDRIV